jgi:hypothetical protein
MQDVSESGNQDVAIRRTGNQMTDDPTSLKDSFRLRQKATAGQDAEASRRQIEYRK